VTLASSFQMCMLYREEEGGKKTVVEGPFFIVTKRTVHINPAI